MLHITRRIIGGFAALVLLGVAVGPAALAEPAQRLVLGRISTEPHKHLVHLRKMADYLSAQLADHGISGIDVVVAESPERMRSLLREGRVDLFSETAFMALDLMNDGFAKPLAREWKKGAAEYHSVIVVRKDSSIKSLSDLVGRKIAFEDAGSTSGYLLPRIALEDSGLRLALLPDPRNPVPRGAVGYSFARGEINVIAWVNRGLADAGAMSNLDWSNPRRATSALKDDLHVIHETEPVIRSLFLARQSLDDELCERIAAILHEMHNTAEGRAVLKSYFDVARYDELAGDALTGLDAARRTWLRLRRMTE